MTKISCLDNKRFVSENGVHTLAYFHKDCNKKDCNDKNDLSQWKKICHNEKILVIMEKICDNKKRLIIMEKDLS